MRSICRLALGWSPSNCNERPIIRSPTGRVSRFGRLLGYAAEPFRMRERNTMFAVVGASKPQPPKSPQLVVGVVEVFGDLKRACPSRMDFGLCTPIRKHHRCGQSSEELHIAACAVARFGVEGCKRTFDPTATFVHQ